MSVRFFKAVAGGNDFIVVDALAESSWQWTSDQVRRACTPRQSVGADGVVVLAPSSVATARFLLWNSDGSHAAFSGNGARCAARVLDHVGRARDGAVTLEATDAVVKARVMGAVVEVDLPLPRDVRSGLNLPVEGGEDCDYVVAGVPYVTVEVDDVDAVALERMAPPLRHWRGFPEGANVAFYQVMDGDRVRLRTWERGVEGETLSSGTGCYAVALTRAHVTGMIACGGMVRTDFDARCGTPLAIELVMADDAVTAARLIGDARVVAELHLLPEALTGFVP